MLHCESSHLHTSTVKVKSSQVCTETIYNLRRSLSNGVQRLMAVSLVGENITSVSLVGSIHVHSHMLCGLRWDLK